MKHTRKPWAAAEPGTGQERRHKTDREKADQATGRTEHTDSGTTKRGPAKNRIVQG